MDTPQNLLAVQPQNRSTARVARGFQLFQFSNLDVDGVVPKAPGGIYVFVHLNN